MEEKLDFKALMEKYKKAKDTVKAEDVEKENKGLLLDIEDKNKKLVNADYAIQQNRIRLNRIKKIMERDPEFTDEPEKLLSETEQKLNEAKAYKDQLNKKIKEAKKKIDENNKSLKKPEEVYNEVVAEAKTKTKTANDKIDEKIKELKAEREKYGIATKDKDGKTIKRITPEERIVIENLTEQINELEKRKETNKTKLDSFIRLIGQAKESNKSVKGESENTNPVNAKPVNGEPVNGEPVNVEPENAEPVNGEPVNAKPVNGEPVNGEPVNGEPVNGEPVNGEPVNGEPVNAEPIRKGKLIEVKVKGKKYEFTYEDNGEISTKEIKKLGFFKELAERINLLKKGKFGYKRTALKIDPTITQKLTEDELQEYIAFVEQRGKNPAPFIVEYDNDKSRRARAFAKSAEKLGLPEPLATENKGVNERFGEGFDQHDNPPTISNIENENVEENSNTLVNENEERD